MYKLAILIPVYNHEEAIGITLEGALRHQLPVLLVDDGSSAQCRDVLDALASQYADRVGLIRLEQNGGKGAAVKAGLKELGRQGFSHALQIDADGQHDLSDLPDFVAASTRQPERLVSGFPKYDHSVPRVRYYCRYLTHIWIWINTLSFQVKDAMCGFRIYPIAPLLEMFQHERVGNRMDFDPEVMVRWVWRGGRVLNIATRVQYPLDGVSHFGVWRDNALISLMHSRMFFGMLIRLPRILNRKFHG